MKGFIKNETGNAVFKLQRPLAVNGILTFENAYLTLGEKSGKTEGPAFVKWLRENVFPEEGWVFYKEEGVLFFPAKKAAAKKATEAAPKKTPAKKKAAAKKAPGKGAGRNLRKTSERVDTSSIDAGTIINAELPQAKAMIAKTTNRGILKKAESLANHFSHKEEHRRLIKRRLEEVY